MYQSLPRGATEIAPRGFFQRSVGGVTRCRATFRCIIFRKRALSLNPARLADSSVPLYHIPQMCITLYTAHLADNNAKKSMKIFMLFFINIFIDVFKRVI